MGGVVSQLCYLLVVEYKCRPSKVASALTFVPPNPPFYAIRETQDGTLQWALDPIVVESQFPGVEINIMKTSRGSYIPGFLFTTPNAKLTVIFSHGNAADCGAMRERYIQLVRRCNVNVFAYDYTGYGAASGTPSEADTYADIRAAYDYLVSKNICPRPESQIVLYGQSVGSGPSCNLAVDKSRPVRALILHSPILSGIRVLVENRGPLCCCDIYPNINHMSKVSVPVLIIHGEADAEVGIHHGQRLHERVPEEHRRTPLWLREAGHNDIVDNFPDEYYAALNRFISSLEEGHQSEAGAVIHEIHPVKRSDGEVHLEVNKHEMVIQ